MSAPQSDATPHCTTLHTTHRTALQHYAVMVLPTSTSFAVSSLSFLISLAAVHLLKGYLISSPLLLISVGIFGSILFLLLLTAVNNAENLVFGKGFQAKLFPEVCLCVLVICLSLGLIHSVCGTVSFLSSLASCYFVNVISQQFYGIQSVPPAAVVGKKKRT
uniref:Dolichyl-diphosphooligosaccharide--protein glycosyltransferase subunit KCP2 n=1 Tax=Mesocestoides corti TaxID=53468 RepID=A0A5K3EKD3_MESCO